MTVVGVLCYQKGSFCASKDSLSMVSSQKNEKRARNRSEYVRGCGSAVHFPPGVKVCRHWVRARVRMVSAVGRVV